jgi:hypothetical protein
MIIFFHVYISRHDETNANCLNLLHLTGKDRWYAKGEGQTIRGFIR